jgi:predicted transcriptional regulator
MKSVKRPVEFAAERPKKRENPRTTQMGNFHAPRQVLYDSRLSHATMRVACWLYDHMKPGDHVATGAIRTIAEDLQIGHMTVQRAIKELVKYRIILTVNQELNNHNVAFNQYRMRIYDNPPLKNVDKITKKSDEIQARNDRALKKTIVKESKKRSGTVTQIERGPSGSGSAVPLYKSDNPKPVTLYGKCAACRGRGLVWSGKPLKEIPCPMCTESV